MSPTTIKYRKKTHALLSYEALFRNLIKDFWQNESIVSSYKREKAGYDGERNVDYKLSTYPHNNFLIFQGIRLPNHPFRFQIDTLILTNRFICILEVKNKRGTFKYDSKQQQLIQEVNGEMHSFKDPILQAEAQKTHLTSWLEHHGIFNIPIETLIVIAYPSTIIENVTKDPDVYNKIIHNESLHQHLDRLSAKYTNQVFTNAYLKKLSQTLFLEDIPLRTDILQEHDLTKHHLVKGIVCEGCGHHPMKRLYKKWQCPKCKTASYNAHEQSIFDHFLLHAATITNKECRELLQIESPRTARTILANMQLRFTGNNSNRKYYSPGLNDFPQNSILPFRQGSRKVQEFY